MNDFAISAALALSICVSHTCSAQQQLPIVNPGFEEITRPLARGEITNGCGGEGVPVGTRENYFAGAQFDDLVEVSGWRTRLPPSNNPTATIHAGVSSPPDWSPPFMVGYVGSHIATLHHVAMQQTLPVLIQPDTTYRLSFLAGFGISGSPEGIYVALIGAPDLETPLYYGQSGTPVVGFTQGIHPPIGSEGQMLPYTLVVTTPEELPPELDGLYLGVSFIGSDGIPQMHYDEFVLTATSHDCIADINNDGLVTPADFTAWIAAFNSSAPECDQNDDGLCTPADFTAWIANYNAGC